MSKALTTKETAFAVLESGIKKSQTKGAKVFVLGALGGLFVSLGFYSTLAVMASVKGTEIAGLAIFLGALVFPVGLILSVLVGGELFTGNSLITLSVLDKKASTRQLATNLLLVWLGNFAGAILTAYLLSNSGEVSLKIQETALAVTHKKLALNSTQVIISGFFCNIIVALAIWGAMSAKDVVSKIFILFIPIFAFVIAGYQHCVANMFLFSFSFFLGGPESLGHMLNDIAMASIGNFLSGGLVIPLAYYYIYIKD